MSMGTDLPGVYLLRQSGDPVLVHAYTDDDYELSDIAELFALGTLDAGVEPGPVLTLTRRELRSVKVQADAESFDHPEGFIEMCLEIYRCGESTEGEALRFVSLE